MNKTNRTRLILATIIVVAAAGLFIVQPWDSGSIQVLWDNERPGNWDDDYSLFELSMVHDPESHVLQLIPHRATITRIEVATLLSAGVIDIYEYAAQEDALFSVKSSDPLTLTFYKEAHDVARVNCYYTNRWGQSKTYGLVFTQSSQKGILHIDEFPYGIPY